MKCKDARLCCARQSIRWLPIVLRRVYAQGETNTQHQAELEGTNDARTGMPHGIPRGAMCVQRFDDSLNSAIHTTYRISLRSSSMPEPRDPLLKVVIIMYFQTLIATAKWFDNCPTGRQAHRGNVEYAKDKGKQTVDRSPQTLDNDPSAGSPTETLLRLLLPLNDRV